MDSHLVPPASIHRRRSLTLRQVALGLLCVAGLVLLLGAGKSRGKPARVQMRFGVDMAQRGAWKEAQYRFQRAAAEAPADGEILNNLAVACEHNGLYEKAEKAYLQAIEHAPENEKIRSNYEHFRIFYAQHLEGLQSEESRLEEGSAPDEASRQDG